MPLQKKKRKKKKIRECWPSKSLIVFHRRAKGTAHLQEEFLRFDEILPKEKKKSSKNHDVWGLQEEYQQEI